MQNLSNLPKIKNLKDYDKARSEIIKKYGNIDGLISIYEYGSVSVPGISDLDIIKVVHVPDKKWLIEIQKHEKTVYKILEKYYNKKYFYEGNIIYHCLKNLNNDDSFFIGNSLPIRNLEKFCPSMNKKLKVYSNRGASGIDGLLATAIGTAHIDKKSKTTLLLGDISFFYDSNSLLIAHKYKININIIVINNKGGQIFSKLPYAKENIKKFREFWTTPVNLSIKKISQLYKANYTSLDSIQKIDNQLKIILKKPGINIIEIPCNFSKTLEIEQKIEKEF